MSKGTLGSFNGTTTANVNMLDIFKQNEMAAHENSTLAFTDHMVIKKIGIQCEAGNGSNYQWMRDPYCVWSIRAWFWSSGYYKSRVQRREVSEHLLHVLRRCFSMADLPFFGNSSFGGGGGIISGNPVVDAELAENGDMILKMSDGTEKNIGSVAGEDGAVYVPHISEQKILSFTIEDEPGDVPDPVDLNPHDEWSDIDDSEIVSDYVWEKM